MPILLQELRYAIRQLYNSPWFALTVVITLALGIGANSAIFSVMNAVSARGIEGLDTGGNYKIGVTVLMTLVSLVLVIACTNVAMLLVAKKSARQREFGLRVALGASRWQIFRQLLLESALLVTLGGLLGWLFAKAATTALATWSQIETGLAPDAKVLLFTFAICAVAALMFGLAPLIPALRIPITSTLKSAACTSFQTRSGKWGGNVVMATQMTFCFVLLVAAGLLLRTLENYKSTNLGLRAPGLLVFGITPQSTPNTSQNLLFYRSLLDRLRSLPGVESVTLADNRIGSGWSDNNSATIDGVQHTYAEAPLRSNNVGPDFFHVLGVPVVEGRDISDSDTATAPRVAVVNETFAKKLMPGLNPIGHQLGIKSPSTIVGIVKDSKYTSVDEKPIPMAYYPSTQSGGLGHQEVELRVSGGGTELLPSIQRALHAIDPNLPLETPMTQEAVFQKSYSQQRMFSRLSAFFGLLAAFLVAIGLYGTLSYRVARRTSEIGVRVAVGARPAQVLWMVLRENLQVTCAGVGAGLLVALALAGLMKSLLFGLQPRDPGTFIAATAMVVMVSLAACILPARHAASIAPVQALRIE